MLTKRIISCLDIKDGRTVKGIAFKELKDAGDPVALAARYAIEGIDELVLLDITATLDGRKNRAALVAQVARNINIPFTVGGGINSIEDVYTLLRAGADKVSVNSSAVINPRLIDDLSKAFGSQCIVLAIDARQVDNDWQVYLAGGTKASGLRLTEWAMEGVSRGAGEILFTAMNNDGARNGFANEALAILSEKVGVPVIASGGAGNMQHFADVLTIGKADAALAASVFHFGDIAVKTLKSFLAKQNIPVRL